MVLKHIKDVIYIFIGKIKDTLHDSFLLLSNEINKVLGHVNRVYCICYSHIMEFHIEKKSPVTETMQGSAIDSLPTVQIPSGFNIKNTYKFGLSIHLFEN